MSEVDISEWTPFDIHPKILQAIKELGFKKPTPIQSESFTPAINHHRDILGAAETGSGKTLAFGIPIITHLINDVEQGKLGLKALVFAPTRELALQVMHHLKSIAKYCSVKIGAIVGGLSEAKQKRILSKNPDLIIATPGRFWQLLDDNEIDIDLIPQIKYLVIDEADRMVEKGHFEELTRILEIINGNFELSKRRQNFVFSATLTFVHSAPKRTQIKNKRFKQIDEKIKIGTLIKLVGMKKKPLVIDLTTKTNTVETLTETKIKCSAKNKEVYLYYFLNENPGRTLIFCNAINTAIRLKSIFTLLGFNFLQLHAKMEMRQRLKNLDKFKENDKAILVATDVAARGLDIPLIKHIVHFHVPKTAEIYVHRSGRTARAMQSGHSLMLIEPQEYPLYLRIWKNLKRTGDLPHFPISQHFNLGAAQERIDLAVKIESMEHQIKSKNARDKWLQNAASILGVESDEEMSEVQSEGHSKQKKQIKFLKTQLAELMKIPLASIEYGSKFIPNAPPMPHFTKKKKFKKFK